MNEALKTKRKRIRSDFLVIGSGLAGLYAAYCASEYGEVALLTKSTLRESNSYWAQGGIAAAVHPEDSPAFHFEDTIKAGRGLCDEEAVEVLVREGRDRVIELISSGMKFDSEDGGLELGLEGGHTKRRVLHAGGNATGKEMVQFLMDSVKSDPRISIFELTTVAALLSDGKRCSGVLALSYDNREQVVYVSTHTILAAGGASALYARTTNPQGAIGEGIALAYRAGAEIMDMEFIQFHPTALYTDSGDSFLISESVRGEGAHLVDRSGKRFMPDYHELGELAPRDIVSRSIYSEMKNSGSNCVFLSLKHLDPDLVRKRFHNIYTICLEHGIDMTTDLVPVAPAAHYTVGGVGTGLMGETSLEGLFACGEVACTGVHGANRLASNSLLECLVFAKRAVDSASGSGTESTDKFDISEEELGIDLSVSDSDRESFLEFRNKISGLMNRYIGIVRNGDEIEKAVSEIEKNSRSAQKLSGFYELKFRNVTDVCSLIAKAALVREESRGAHIREDFPDEDPAWIAHIVWGRDKGYTILKK